MLWYGSAERPEWASDHNIRAFFTHLRYVFTRRFGDVVNGDFAGEIGFIPGHDLRRYKTDVADFQRLLLPS